MLESVAFSDIHAEMAEQFIFTSLDRFLHLHFRHGGAWRERRLARDKDMGDKLSIPYHSLKNKKSIETDVLSETERPLPPPCNHLDNVVLRLPTFARNQAGDWLMPSQGRQPSNTGV